LTETQFIEENKESWQELEYLLSKKDKDPDKLHDLFVKVSSDLAYASTFYPKRSVRAYLNQLTQQVFDSMEEKKTDWGLYGIKYFFQHTLPIELHRTRKALLASFLIFGLALLIGIVSSANNEDFARVILGDAYVDMTVDNINNKDPMAVYKDQEQTEMFLGITINNIRVAFLCFILGLLGSLGTIVVLFFNGIMVGAFQYFFYSKGLFVESFLTIWIHGTIEISAIIIAGSAGIILGNGLLFPKTYNRSDSLQIAAKRAARIIVGTIPLFILAGFLESFITRLTDLPTIVKVLIISLSALYIIGMYIAYPWWYYKNNQEEIDNEEIIPNRVEELSFNKKEKRTVGSNLAIAFSLYRTNFGRYFKHAVTPVLIFMALALYVYDVFFYDPSKNKLDSIVTYIDNSHFLDYTTGSWVLFVILLMVIGFVLMILNMLYRDVKIDTQQKLLHIKYYLPTIILIIAIPVAVFYFSAFWWAIVLLLVVPLQIFVRLIHDTPDSGWAVLKDIRHYAGLSYRNYFPSLAGFGVALFLHYALILVVYSQIGHLIFDFISWHDIGETTTNWSMIARSLLFLLMTLLVLPLYYYSLMNFSLSIESKTTASDLWDRYEHFNTSSPVFERKS